MKANIVGGGPSKALVTSANFTIGTNLHCKWANIIFAVDEPIIKKLVADSNLSQLIFMTPQTYKFFNEYKRCYEFDSRKWFNTSSLCSALNAVALGYVLGFEDFNLYGFEKVQQNDKEKLVKLGQILDKTKRYKFIC